MPGWRGWRAAGNFINKPLDVVTNLCQALLTPGHFQAAHQGITGDDELLKGQACQVN
jgi:hypothetical protein